MPNRDKKIGVHKLALSWSKHKNLRITFTVVDVIPPKHLGTYIAVIDFAHSSSRLTVLFHFKYSDKKGVYQLNYPRLHNVMSADLSMELLAGVGAIVERQTETLIPLISLNFKDFMK